MTLDLSPAGQGQRDPRLERPPPAAMGTDPNHSHRSRTQTVELDVVSKRIGFSHELLFSTLGELDDEPNLLEESYPPDDGAVESTFDEPSAYTFDDGCALEDEIPSKLANLEERSSEIARFSETLSLDGDEEESEKRNYDSDCSTGSTAPPTLTDMFGEMKASADLDSIFFPESIFTSVHNTKTFIPINEEERPYLVHQSDSTEIYRINDIGIKVITGEVSLEEQNKKLGHERNMSSFLSSTSRKRNVIEKKEFDGRPALWFEWEDGVTLRSWLQNRYNELNPKVRVAMAIAKTLSEFHDGGVFYNNLSLENIVLNTVEGVEIATFIDLSKSGFIDMRPNADKDYTDMLRRSDLEMMGKVFRAVFYEEDPIIEQDQKEETAHESNTYDDDICESGRKKRGKLPSPCDFLPNSFSRLPLYIHSLISSLVSSGSNCTAGYSSAKDVLLDLKVFSENLNSNLNMTLVDEASIVQGNLQFGGGRMFYGRQVQLTMIQHFFDSVIRNEGCPLMSVVSGCPGAG